MNLVDYIKQQKLKGLVIQFSKLNSSHMRPETIYLVCKCGHCQKTEGYISQEYTWTCPGCNHDSRRRDSDKWRRLTIPQSGALELLDVNIQNESALRVDCYRLAFIEEQANGCEPSPEQFVTRPFECYESMIHHLDGRVEFLHPQSQLSLQEIVIGDTRYVREEETDGLSIQPHGLTIYGNEPLKGSSCNKGMDLFRAQNYGTPLKCSIQVAKKIAKHRVFQTHAVYSFDRLFKVNSIGEFFHTFYYFHWMVEKHAAFEQVARGGYHDFIAHWLDLYFQEPNKDHQVQQYFKQGKKESQIVSVPVFIRRWLKENQASFDTYKKFLQIHQVSPISEETFESYLAMEEWLDITRLWRIIREEEISFNDMIQYLGQCQTRQAVHYEEALSLWDDYLKMAKRCQLQVKKFPPSVKLAYDVMVKNFNEMGNAQYAEDFAKQAEQNKQWEYHDETLGFSLIVPQTIRELIEEGQTLRHRIGSYDSRVAKGETVILFLRQTNQIKKPLYTIEWNPEDRLIIQAKGKLNHSISDPLALKMLDQFQAKFAL